MNIPNERPSHLVCLFFKIWDSLEPTVVATGGTSRSRSSAELRQAKDWTHT